MVGKVQHQLFIVSGQQGSGKTTFLQHVLLLLEQHHVKTGGILSLGTWVDDQRDHFELVNIRNNERVLFCQRRFMPGWEKIGPFYVNPSGQSFGDQALSDQTLGDCRVVVIDEIGPFELQGKGWAAHLDRLIDDSNRVLLIAVRKHLLQEVMKKWGIADPFLFDVRESTAAHCCRKLLASLDHGL